MVEPPKNFPEGHLNKIYKEKLFKLFVPEEVGGAPTSLPEALRIIKTLSEQSPDLGWAVAIGAGGGYFYPYLHASVREAVFKDDHAVIAGSGHLGGLAIPEDDGYRVSGRWNYCSGALYATCFTANCILADASGHPTDRIRSFVFNKKDVRIEKDWRAFGLQLTESHTMVVEDTYVKDSYTFNVNEPPLIDVLPVHTFPFLSFSQSCFAMVCKGIWNSCVESAEETINDNEESWEKGRPDKVRATLRMSNDRIRSISQDFSNVMERVWEKHLSGEAVNEVDQHAIRTLCVTLSSDATRFAHELLGLLGMNVIMWDHPYNKAYRDLLVASQHSLLKWSSED